MSILLNAALAYAARGRHVFPCRGKTPLTAHGLHDATSDPATVKKFWNQFPEASIGIDCGRSSLFVGDVDLEGMDAWADLCARNGGHEPTLTARTPSGGLHVYFTAAEDEAWARCTVGKLAPGIDTRAKGGYVIAPPSAAYTWLVPNREAAAAPHWVAKLLTPPAPRPGERADLPPGLPPGRRLTRYGERALVGLVDEMLAAPEGTRNDRLNRAAYRAGQLAAAGQLEAGVAVQALVEAATRTGLSLIEATRTARSGVSAGVDHPARVEDRL